MHCTAFSLHTTIKLSIWERPLVKISQVYGAKPYTTIAPSSKISFVHYLKITSNRERSPLLCKLSFGCIRFFFLRTAFIITRYHLLLTENYTNGVYLLQPCYVHFHTDIPPTRRNAKKLSLNACQTIVIIY